MLHINHLKCTKSTPYQVENTQNEKNSFAQTHTCHVILCVEFAQKIFLGLFAVLEQQLSQQREYGVYVTRNIVC